MSASPKLSTEEILIRPKSLYLSLGDAKEDAYLSSARLRNAVSRPIRTLQDSNMRPLGLADRSMVICTAGDGTLWTAVHDTLANASGRTTPIGRERFLKSLVEDGDRIYRLLGTPLDPYPHTAGDTIGLAFRKLIDVPDRADAAERINAKARDGLSASIREFLLNDVILTEKNVFQRVPPVVHAFNGDTLRTSLVVGVSPHAFMLLPHMNYADHARCMAGSFGNQPAPTSDPILAKLAAEGYLDTRPDILGKRLANALPVLALGMLAAGGRSDSRLSTTDALDANHKDLVESLVVHAMRGAMGVVRDCEALGVLQDVRRAFDACAPDAEFPFSRAKEKTVNALQYGRYLDDFVMPALSRELPEDPASPAPRMG